MSRHRLRRNLHISALLKNETYENACAFAENMSGCYMVLYIILIYLKNSKPGRYMTRPAWQFDIEFLSYGYFNDAGLRFA